MLGQETGRDTGYLSLYQEIERAYVISIFELPPSFNFGYC